MNGDSKTRCRILVVDDHPIVRLGLRQMISGTSDLSVCCEADTAESALRLARSSKPDLVIVDLSLGNVTGLDLVRALHDADPGLPVLVLSMHDESLFAQRALRAGARGYITKQEAIDGLIHAVREVLAGRIYLSETASQRIFEGVRGATPESSYRLGGLTDRELQVFEMVGRGVATAAIADRLGVSVKTVETYRSNIKTKLHLQDATELIRYATSWVERL
jgi:DNA-binding NarL/FixJ family response regulator